jgi:phosphate transport system ATP-binding protein
MFKFGMSLIATSLTLACRALAMTVANSRDPILAVLKEYREGSLAENYTIVIVTHNMQQAARTSDMSAFFMMEEDRADILVEYGATVRVFANPKDKRTEDHVTDRFN